MLQCFSLNVTNFALSALLMFSVELLYSLLTIMEDQHGTAIEVFADDREEL